MSNCKRPLEPMLTAELAELEGIAVTDLGRHVRVCPHCSAAARKILAANAVLDASLAEGRAIYSGSLLARARSTEQAPGMGRFRWSGGWLAIGPTLGWAAGAIGVLAFATVLLVVAPRHEPLPDAESPPGLTAAELTTQPPLIHAPGYDVAVIPTENPDVTIIWFSKENDDADATDAIRDGPIAVGPANGL